MASSKQGIGRKPLRNEILEFMLKTDDELSDLSNSDLSVIDVSSNEELSSDMNENF